MAYRCQPADVEIDAESDPEHLVLASKAGVHRVPRWDTNALVDGLGKMVNSMVGPGSKTWGLSVVGDEDA